MDLEGLQKPIEEMTEEELRDKIRELRINREKSGSPRSSKGGSKKKKQTKIDFDAILASIPPDKIPEFMERLQKKGS